MSPRRPERDIEGVNRVLTVLGILLGMAAFSALAYGAWRLLDEIRFGGPGDVSDAALTYTALTVVFTALAIGCLRLAGDDGSGTWCETCIARNSDNAPLCENCGAALP